MGMTELRRSWRGPPEATVKVSDVVEPAWLAMSHENAALVISQFQEIFEGTGWATVWDHPR